MYQICLYAINKSQNGYLTPEEFNLLANQAQTSYMDYLLGEFQQYQYGKPESRVNYDQNSNTRQRLVPFIHETILTVDLNGESIYPTNYLQTDALTTVSDYQRIRFVRQDSLYSFVNSQIDPVATNPIYVLIQSGFKFMPFTLGSARLSYIGEPNYIQWGYCLDSNGRPIYNPSAPPITTTTTTTSPGCTYSIQPLWYDVDILEIVARILKLVGVNLQMAQVEQYANQITQTGQ